LIREYLINLTSTTHLAGTFQDYQTALYVQSQLTSFGLESWIEEYDNWLSFPLERNVR